MFHQNQVDRHCALSSANPSEVAEKNIGLRSKVSYGDETFGKEARNATAEHNLMSRLPM